MRRALPALDNIDLLGVLRQRTFMFATPPTFIRGRVRAAMHFSLEQILAAQTPVETTRAWTLWMLLPRMILQRPAGTRTLPKDEWRRRILAFQRGEWHQLLATPACPLTHTETQHPAQHQTPPSPERRAERARHLVHQGELSAARQALTATPPAPGTAATLAQLRDPVRRPTEPYSALPEEVQHFAPADPLHIPAERLLTALRRSRKGAAPGPSGLTADTLRLVLDNEATTNLFVDVCQMLAQARIPPHIAKALGLGRMVALQKPHGGVRGLVIGDVLRRVVSRSMAQLFASQFHTACSPHQFALSTRAGTGAIVHALTTTTEHNHASTILSIDGIGAYDTISRASMLQGLCNTPDANRCLPFVRLWYSSDSEYVWHDANGQHHSVTQAEGGEQGDPMMPALFSLGQQPALQRVQAQLEPGETLYAFLDDIYAVVQPHRVRPVYDLLAHHLATHAHIRLNQGKTRIWNRGGHEPANTSTLGRDTWVGNPALPPNQQGLTVLGAPIGTAAYIEEFLQNTVNQHQPLLDQLPTTFQISKPHGCCCSTQPAPVATTYSGSFHPQQQAPLPKITISPLHVASASSCTVMICR